MTDRSRLSPARVVAVLLATLAICAACGSPPVTPAAVVSAPSAAPTPIATPQPAPPTTPPPTPTPEPVPASWAAVDPMPEGLDLPQAVKLADGRVLVVGQRRGKDGFAVETIAQLWDPATDDWHQTAGPGGLRAGFALVALDDGRALMIGGNDPDFKALATTLTFDPATERWSKAAKLGTPRADPAADVLPDGRVLVTGGHTGLKFEGSSGRTLPARGLADYRGSEPIRRSRPTLDDMIPPVKVKALATTELYDPKAGTWSPTGPMRFPRSGALATTLSDGRVLVVGSVSQEGLPIWPDDRALTTAEIYDPTTGRFTSAGKLPALSKVPGVDSDLLSGRPWLAGTLVALPDGDAALVGRVTSEYNTSGVTRSFRFDADSSSWSEMGEPWIKVSIDGADPIRVADGADIGGAAVVALADGRVLTAGGGASQAQMDSPVLAATRIYDPITDTWTKGPKLPEAKTMATGVRLDDGTILVVGGYAERYWTGTPPLTTVARFVPEH